MQRAMPLMSIMAARIGSFGLVDFLLLGLASGYSVRLDRIQYIPQTELTGALCAHYLWWKLSANFCQE